MALTVVSDKCYCTRCGRAYGSRKGFFPVSYAALYKGAGYLPICRECVSSMFNHYLEQCNDQKLALKQICRKLDLYWSEQAYDYVEKKNTPRTIISSYLQRINGVNYAGKSYDDTLNEAGILWDSLNLEPKRQDLRQSSQKAIQDYLTDDAAEQEQVYIVKELDPIEITEDVVAFWGPGYTPEMYVELEQRLQYYRSQMGEDQSDMSADAILRQIVMLEIDINRARAEGKDDSKMMTTLNSLISSLIKPTKKGDESGSANANTPFGVWIKRWEDERPLPEVDDSLKDVDGIVKYVNTWVYGHIAHMLGIRNNHSKLYEEAIAKFRVERPEYDEEDDDALRERYLNHVRLPATSGNPYQAIMFLMRKYQA